MFIFKNREKSFISREKKKIKEKVYFAFKY